MKLTKNKKAQDFGTFPLIGKILVTLITLGIILAIVMKAGEWIGVWDIPWF